MLFVGAGFANKGRGRDKCGYYPRKRDAAAASLSILSGDAHELFWLKCDDCGYYPRHECVCELIWQPWPCSHLDVIAAPVPIGTWRPLVIMGSAAKHAAAGRRYIRAIARGMRMR